MRILVTGGAGFIGSHLVERMMRSSHEVTCIDNFDDYYDPALKRQNLAGAAQLPGFQLIEGDIRDRPLVEQVLADRYDAVVHLAARPGVRRSIEEPLLYEQVNVQGTINLLEVCRRRDVRHFVLASSSSVYGLSKDVPFKETSDRLVPASPYGTTKLAAEYFCRTFHHLYGISVTCLRFFTVYGPRQRPDMAIHKFTRLIEEGNPVPVYGDTTSRRDYTYVDDIVDGVVRAIGRPRAFEIYNLGTCETVGLGELIAVLEQALGKAANLAYKPHQPGDVPITHADLTHATRDLDYNPSVHIQEGVRRFVDWFRASQ